LRALERIEAGAPTEANLRKRTLAISRVPLVMTGSSGAGKTRIWARLTEHHPKDAMSVFEDDGYIVRPSRKPLALTTIPGQDSKVRYALLDELFGFDTTVQGVLHVVANGWDHAWPISADTVANQLPRFNLPALLERNRRQELYAFEDICKQIRKKHVIAPSSHRPNWLLVIVNKIDLYWSSIQEAEEQYIQGCGSEFDLIARDLVERIGTQNIHYQVLPVSCQPSNFRFDSARGTIEAKSQLSRDQCSASILSLVETVEELNVSLVETVEELNGT
jgi:hypothetical protein